MIRLQPKIGLVFRLAVAALAMLWSTSASASLLIADNFVRVGPDEVVAAPFTAPSTSTVNAYSGLVEIIASGTGFSLFDILNDAFYGVSSTTPLDSQYYQLNIGWTSAPLAPLSGEPRNIDNFIVFIEDAAQVIIVDFLHARSDLPGKIAALSSTKTQNNH